MKRVYVSGPYSKPDPAENTRRAIDAADVLFRCGYAPYVPHLSHYWEQHHAHSYQAWLWLDLQWLAVSEAMVRLPGESPGADIEEDFCRERGIPVFHGVEAFLAAHLLGQSPKEG